MSGLCSLKTNMAYEPTRDCRRGEQSPIMWRTTWKYSQRPRQWFGPLDRRAMHSRRAQQSTAAFSFATFPICNATTATSAFASASAGAAWFSARVESRRCASASASASISTSPSLGRGRFQGASAAHWAHRGGRTVARAHDPLPAARSTRTVPSHAVRASSVPLPHRDCDCTWMAIAVRLLRIFLQLSRTFFHSSCRHVLLAALCASLSLLFHLAIVLPALISWSLLRVRRLTWTALLLLVDSSPRALSKSASYLETVVYDVAVTQPIFFTVKLQHLKRIVLYTFYVLIGINEYIYFYCIFKIVKDYFVPSLL